MFTHGHALLVGVGYDLPVTTQDASALYSLLVDPQRAGYPVSQVELRMEGQSTRQGILDAFTRLRQRAALDPDSTVIIYFSGHGGKIGKTQEESEFFLVPYAFDPANRADTAISGAEFTSEIDSIRARKLVVILDCCHAGGIPQVKGQVESFISTPVPSDLFKILESGSGKVIIASSSENEYSFTGTPYSLFTTCLIEALSGKATVHDDGYARILDILIYLYKFVPERAAGRQHPFVNKIVALGDNFPLCYYRSTLPKVPTSPSSPFVTSSIPVWQRRHWIEQRSILESEWKLRIERLSRLREELGIRTDILAIFEIEKRILQEESALAELDYQMRELDEKIQMV